MREVVRSVDKRPLRREHRVVAEKIDRPTVLAARFTEAIDATKPDKRVRCVPGKNSEWRVINSRNRSAKYRR